MLEKKHHQTFVQTEQNLFFLQAVNFLKQLYVLIKPGVISLVIFTALCAMLLAPSDKSLFIKGMSLTLIAIGASGSAILTCGLIE